MDRGTHPVPVGIAIRQDHGVHHLNSVLANEMRNIGVAEHQCLVERSAVELKSLKSVVHVTTIQRIVLLATTRVELSSEEQIRQLLDELSTGNTRANELEHLNVLHVLLVVLDRTLVVEEVTKIELGAIQIAGIAVVPDVLIGGGDHPIRESLQLERDPSLLAEHRQHHRLLGGFEDRIGHRPGPVENDQEPVVLPVPDDLVLGEDVLGPAVVDHLHGVETTALGDHGPLVLVGSLLHLELLDHVVHGTLLTGEPLVEPLARGLACIRDSLLGGCHDPSRRSGGREGIWVGVADPLRDLLNRNENLLDVAGRDHGVRRILGVGTVFSEVVGDVLVHQLLRADDHRTTLTVSTGPLGVRGIERTMEGSLFLDLLVEIPCDLDDILESLGVLHAIDPDTLLVGERNVDDSEDSQLEVQVQTIHQTCLRESTHLLDREDLVVPQPAIADHEVTLDAGVLRLDQTLDASILDDVQHTLGTVRVVRVDVHTRLEMTRLLVNRGVGEQSMSDFMPDEHVVDLTRHAGPQWEGEYPILDVERSSLGVLLVDDTDCFGRKQSGKR